MERPRVVERGMRVRVERTLLGKAGGLPEERAFNTNTHTTFNNTWSFHTGFTLGQLGETYCYSCARGGPAVRQDPYIAPWGGLHRDDRKAIVPDFWVN